MEKNQLNKCSNILFLFEICVLKKNGVVHVTVVNNNDMCRRACWHYCSKLTEIALNLNSQFENDVRI